MSCAFGLGECAQFTRKRLMGLLSWLGGDPESKLQKQIAVKSEAAMQLQRSGKIKEYAAAMSEVEALGQKLDDLREQKG